MTTMQLGALLRDFRPGSDDWTWDDEKRDLRALNPRRLRWMVQSVRRDGIRTPILLGPDGRVWDGHHRVTAARIIGLDRVPVELVLRPTPFDESNQPIRHPGGVVE